MIRRWLWLCLLVIALWMSGRASVDAQTTSTSLTLSAQAAFDGRYRDAEGRWIPMRITLANTGPEVQAELRVRPSNTFSADSFPNQVRSLVLPTQSRREFFMYVPAGTQYFNSVAVDVVVGGQVALSTTVDVRPISTGDWLAGLLVNQTGPFGPLSSAQAGANVYLAPLTVPDLPPNARGWSALDVLVVQDVDTSTLSAEQRQALATWVNAGGRLWVMGGPSWQKTVAGLRDLLPVTVLGTATSADISLLQKDIPLSTSSAVVTQVSLLPGARLLAQTAAGQPLISVIQRGFGEVLFFAADPTLAPLNTSGGLSQLYAGWLTGTLSQPMWVRGPSDTSSLREAARAFPNQDLPNVLLVCGLLGFYLVLLVPVNWVVLRLAKRMEWAWVTLPVTVLVFTVGLYSAGALLRGSLVTLHRVAVAYSGPGASIAQVDQVVGLLSPERRDYTVRFPVGALALSGFGYGDISGQMQQGEQFTAMQVRSDIAAINEFWTQGQTAAWPIQASLVLRTTSNGAVRLTGVITNTSPQTLEEAVFLAPGAHFGLGDFAPGAAQTINLMLSTSMSILSTDTTVDEVLGGGNYYDNRDSYRRYNLMSAMARSYNNDGTGRGSGIYLAGWSSNVPLTVTVADAAFDTDDLTLHLIGLPYELAVTDGVFEVPPNLMRARPLDSTALGNVASTPYNIEISPGNTYQISFQPDLSIDFRRVVAVSLLVDTSVPMANRQLAGFVWNFTTNVWEPLDTLRSGLNRLPNPTALVGPRGEVRLRLDNNDTFNVLINEVSVSLTLEQ